MTKCDSIFDILDNHLSTEETPEALLLMNPMKFSKSEGFFIKGILYDILDWKVPSAKGA